MEYRRSSGEFINSFPEHETKLMEPNQTDDGSLALTKSNSISRFNRRNERGITLSDKVILKHNQLHIQDAYQAKPFHTSSKSLRYQPLRCLDDCSLVVVIRDRSFAHLVIYPPFLMIYSSNAQVFSDVSRQSFNVMSNHVNAANALGLTCDTSFHNDLCRPL
jgi:hypothetical protein